MPTRTQLYDPTKINDENLTQNQRQIRASDSRRILEGAFLRRLDALVDQLGGSDATANVTNASKSSVDRWKSGRAEPSLWAIVDIARATGVSLDWLATGEGPMHPEQGRGNGDRPRQDGDLANVWQGRDNLGSERTTQAQMPSAETFDKIAKVVKDMVEALPREEILSSPCDEIGTRLRLMYYVIKDAAPPGGNSQKK